MKVCFCRLLINFSEFLLFTFRYPYYMLNVIDREIGFVTWLRYTAWIPLYPTGFVLEGNHIDIYCIYLVQISVLYACINKCHHGRCIIVLFTPYRLWGYKNRPALFPGRMSYKATKPGLACLAYLSMLYYYCIVVY